MELPDYEKKYLIFGMFFLLSNQLQTIGDSFFDEVTTKQWFILASLDIMNDKSPTLNELSDAVGSSHQNVKQLVLKLEKKGFISLKKDETDQRRLRIGITPKCEEFRASYAQKTEIFMERLFKHLDDKELEITLQALIKLKDNLEGMENEDGRK